MGFSEHPAKGEELGLRVGNQLPTPLEKVTVHAPHSASIPRLHESGCLNLSTLLTTQSARPMMNPTKAHRKRHSRSRRTYVSFSPTDSAILSTLKAAFRDSLGHDLSVPLILSMALEELMSQIQETGVLPNHPDARVTR
jgi:hypothetical protein